jgi:hypothetical protein
MSTNIQVLPGKVGISNTSPIHTLDVGSNVYVDDTAENKLTVEGKIYTTDITVASNLTVMGTTTVVNTENLSIKDPIIELARDSIGTGDTGILMKRAVNESNVAVFYDEGAGFKISHTMSGANGTQIAVDTANALPINLYGNVTVTSNLEVGTANLFVDTTTGNVGVGTNSPGFSLDVHGTSNVGALTTTSVSGNGSGLTSLNAGNLASGTVPSARLSLTASDIPNLSASKITSGTLTRPISTTTGTFSGDVGIGTTSPTDLLDVHYPTPSYGSSVGTEEGSLTVSSGAEHSNAAVYFRTPFNAAAPAKMAIFSSGGGYSGANGGGLHFCLENTNNNTTKVDLNNSKMVVKADGKVGIATTSPAYTLDVHGTSNVGALTTTSVSGDGSSLTSLNADNLSSGTVPSARLSLAASDIPDLSASKITSGTLGRPISTTTGTFSGAVTTGNILYVGTNTNNETAKTIYFGGTYGDNGYDHCVIERRVWEASSEKQELLLFSGNDGETVSGPDRIRLKGAQILFDTLNDSTDRTTENTKMIIRADGDVGIGTTSPAYKLDVHGTANVGTLTTTSVSGDGSGLTSLNATNISSGTLGTARIPNLDAGKITTGTLTRPISTTTGTFSGDVRIPTLSTAAIGKITPVYARGTGNNNNANRLVKIGDTTHVNTSGRGLTLTIINASTHAHVSSTNYDTYGSTTASNNLATALEAMTDAQIGILTSVDAHEGAMTANLITAALKLGLTRLAASSGATARHPYAAIFYGPGASGVSGNHALEVMKSTDASGAYATLSTFLVDDSFIGQTLTNALYSGAAEVTTPAVIVDRNGNVGIGTTSPSYKLDVHGTSNVGALTATSVSGNGSSLTSLNATNISTGTLGTARIPNLDAGKITTGTLTMPISTTTGTFSGVVTCSNVLKLEAGSTTGDSSVEDTNKTNTYIRFGEAGTGSDWAYLRQIGGSNLIKLALDFHDDNEARFEIRKVNSSAGSGSGEVVTTVFSVDDGAVSATSFSGSGSSLTSLNATNISSGTLGTARIPNLDAGKITTGTLDNARIPNLDAGKITTGTLTRPISTTTGTFSGLVTMRGQQDDADGSNRADYWNYDDKVALVLEPAADDGAVAILFPSQGNKSSDFAYIVYDEDYGEAGVTAGENGALILGCENDGAGSSDHVRIKSRLVVEADHSSSDPTNAFQVKSSNTTGDLFTVTRSGNVGIGTASPGKTLDVNGVLRSRYTAGRLSGTFDTSGLNIGDFAESTSAMPQIGWEIHLSFSVSTEGANVRIYGAYTPSQVLVGAAEKATITFAYNTSWGWGNQSNSQMYLVSHAYSNNPYYAIIRVHNPIYTNADAGLARHHITSECTGVYTGVGAAIWKSVGFVDLGGENSTDRFNRLRIVTSSGNIKGQWTAFPITT